MLWLEKLKGELVSYNPPCFIPYLMLPLRGSFVAKVFYFSHVKNGEIHIFMVNHKTPVRKSILDFKLDQTDNDTESLFSLK